MDKLSWKLESLTKTSLVHTLWGQWDQQACSPSLRICIHLASPLAAKAGESWRGRKPAHPRFH